MKKNKPFLKRVSSFMLLFGIVLVFFIKMYQMFSVDLIMKDLHGLEQRKMKLVSETARLQAEVDRLKNIDRISKIAGTDLELVNNTEKVLVLRLQKYNAEENSRQFPAADETVKLAGVQ